jgi:hypothetical protein
MRRLLTALAVALLIGCGDGGPGGFSAPQWPIGPGAPSAPEPPGPLTFVWAMVVEDSGICIEEARIEIVQGPGAGRGSIQETPCDAWWFGGVTFDSLSVGIGLTLRATAPGYAGVEKKVIPTPGAQTAVLLTPARLKLD